MSGTRPRIVVPTPIVEVTSSTPPIAPSRSPMFTNPWPAAACVDVEPAPVSATSNISS